MFCNPWVKYDLKMDMEHGEAHGNACERAARRTEIDGGIDWVLVHDAELLKRLEDA